MQVEPKKLVAASVEIRGPTMDGFVDDWLAAWP